MKQPTPSDFIVNVKESSVSVTFKPSDSDYNFGRLADPEDIARYGPLSQPPNVRHGNTGDTGDYPPEEVAQMAHSLAVKADHYPVTVREMRRTPRGYAKFSEQLVGTGMSYIGVKPTRSVSNLMSDHSINDPKHWLDRAKETRALAEQIGDPEAKRTMLKNADDSRNEPKNEQRAAGLNQSSCSIRGNCARVGRNELHYQAGRAAFGILRQDYGGGAVAFTPAFFARLIDFGGVILEALVVARHLVPSTQSSTFAGRGRSVTSLVIC